MEEGGERFGTEDVRVEMAIGSTLTSSTLATSTSAGRTQVGGGVGGSHVQQGEGAGGEDVYEVKHVQCRGRDVHVVVQNANGPCPLLAMANVLSLRGSLDVRGGARGAVTGEELVGKVCEVVLARNEVAGAQAGAAGAAARQATNDALELLPLLQYGMNVNVRFGEGVDGFEFTPEMAVFDAAGVRMVHGWLVDPEGDAAGAAVLRVARHFNALQERLLMARSGGGAAAGRGEGFDGGGEDGGLLEADLAAAEAFLEGSGAQLTEYGLAALRRGIPEGEVCVLFRNNHFATVTVEKGQMYLLATDAGFVDSPHVVWECVRDASGNNDYVTGDFLAPTHAQLAARGALGAGGAGAPASASAYGEDLERQSARDEMLARMLQDEEMGLARQPRELTGLERRIQAREEAAAEHNRRLHAQLVREQEDVHAKNQREFYLGLGSGGPHVAPPYAPPPPGSGKPVEAGSLLLSTSSGSESEVPLWRTRRDTPLQRARYARRMADERRERERASSDACCTIA